jgi:hypothetical protein
MPILEVVSKKQIPKSVVTELKISGGILGYTDPKKIWVRSSSDLTQDDVVYVLVRISKEDAENTCVKLFYGAIGDILRTRLDKSVEVIPCVMETSLWFPTAQGIEVYGTE